MTVSPDQVQNYRDQGYVVMENLFSADEARHMIDHYMAMRAEGAKPGDFGGTEDQPDDPTHQYPRLIQMHDWDGNSRGWAFDARVLAAVEKLIDDRPALNQSMLYFKPPGGRGQGLHQDEQYINIDPLIGVWMALDKADADVGHMLVVPGSHKLDMQPVEQADTSVSFTPVQTTVPNDAEAIGLDMNPGDTLFFHGRIIHGSLNNTTTNRFRRSFICHYVGENSRKFEPEQGTHVSHVQGQVDRPESQT